MVILEFKGGVVWVEFQGGRGWQLGCHICVRGQGAQRHPTTTADTSGKTLLSVPYRPSFPPLTSFLQSQSPAFYLGCPHALSGSPLLFGS